MLPDCAREWSFDSLALGLSRLYFAFCFDVQVDSWQRASLGMGMGIGVGVDENMERIYLSSF